MKTFRAVAWNNKLQQNDLEWLRFILLADGSKIRPSGKIPSRTAPKIATCSMKHKGCGFWDMHFLPSTVLFKLGCSNCSPMIGRSGSLLRITLGQVHFQKNYILQNPSSTCVICTVNYPAVPIYLLYLWAATPIRNAYPCNYVNDIEACIPLKLALAQCFVLEMLELVTPTSEVLRLFCLCWPQQFDVKAIQDSFLARWVTRIWRRWRIGCKFASKMSWSWLNFVRMLCWQSFGCTWAKLHGFLKSKWHHHRIRMIRRPHVFDHRAFPTHMRVRGQLDGFLEMAVKSLLCLVHGPVGAKAARRE